MNVVTKQYRVARNKCATKSRRDVRAARAHRNAVVRADRRAARIALHVGDYERVKGPLKTLTEYAV